MGSWVISNAAAVQLKSWAIDLGKSVNIFKTAVIISFSLVLHAFPLNLNLNSHRNNALINNLIIKFSTFSQASTCNDN